MLTAIVPFPPGAPMDTSSIPLTTAAIIIPIFSLFAILLDIPPISWHIRNCNIGSSALILWLIILNTSNFLNALIWPRNNMQGWWKGEGYCDIQVRLLVGGSIGGLPGAVLCIMKALARVLDPKKTIVNASSADRRRRFVMDGLLCFGLPIFFMVVLYVVHSWRYNIVGVSGCDVTLDRSWVTIVLLFIWPPILLLVSCYYACLVIFRLYRYRAQTAGLLHLNKTTRSRFLRLFIMAVFVLLLLFPAQLVQLFTFALDHRQEPFHPYSWSLVHTDWDLAILISSKAVPTPWGKYSWIAEGYVVFAFFGLGCDARDMYRGWLAWLGLGKLFPSLLEKTQHKRSSGSNTWFGSMGSKAKVLFSRKGSADDSVATNSTLVKSPAKSSFRLSALSSSTKHSNRESSSDLPFAEPPRKIQPQKATQRQSKWHLLSSMPTFPQATAGAQHPPSSTKRTVPPVISRPFPLGTTKLETYSISGAKGGSLSGPPKIAQSSREKESRRVAMIGEKLDDMV